MNLPLYLLHDRGSGTDSLLESMSSTTSDTTLRMPLRAVSGVFDSQLKLGNSTQSPTYSPSSSDHVTLYVYRSSFKVIINPQLLYCLKNLSYLIYLGFSPIVLNIYARVSLPRCFIYTMAGASLAGRTEILITDFA